MLRTRLPALAQARVFPDEDWYRGRFNDLNAERRFLRVLAAAPHDRPARYVLLRQQTPGQQAPVEFTSDLAEALDRFVREQGVTSVFDLGPLGSTSTRADHVPLRFRVAFPARPRYRADERTLVARARKIIGPAGDGARWRAEDAGRFLVVDMRHRDPASVSFARSAAGARHTLRAWAAVIDDATHLYDLAAPGGAARLPIELTVTTSRCRPLVSRTFRFD